VKVTFGGQRLSGMEIMECNWGHKRRVVHRMKVGGPEWKALELHKEVFPSVMWEFFTRNKVQETRGVCVGFGDLCIERSK